MAHIEISSKSKIIMIKIEKNNGSESNKPKASNNRIGWGDIWY